jgi:EAL domain-containing protein (putative c-di-GMP-specific phosphodiesterase class I)
MGKEAEFRRWVESELHTALEQGNFEIHYQPQVDMRTGVPVGFEALLRWRHPERGIISPMDFIPVAEETGFIAQLGEWVLMKACRDTKMLPDECFVAVNLSPVQFMMDDIVRIVRDAIRISGIEPRRLELEITESVMMQDRAKASLILKRLAEMGVSVAVDDFGTGYSNLGYLADFEFKKLKIDRSFVRKIGTDRSSDAIVSTIVGLSRALGVRTTAEGVETEDQAVLLRAAGCEVVQGYYYGKPVPLSDLREAPVASAAVH